MEIPRSSLLTMEDVLGENEEIWKPGNLGPKFRAKPFQFPIEMCVSFEIYTYRKPEELKSSQCTHRYRTHRALYPTVYFNRGYCTVFTLVRYHLLRWHVVPQLTPKHVLIRGVCMCAYPGVSLTTGKKYTRHLLGDNVSVLLIGVYPLHCTILYCTVL